MYEHVAAAAETLSSLYDSPTPCYSQPQITLTTTASALHRLIITLAVVTE